MTDELSTLVLQIVALNERKMQEMRDKRFKLIRYKHIRKLGVKYRARGLYKNFVIERNLWTGQRSNPKAYIDKLFWLAQPSRYQHTDYTDPIEVSGFEREPSTRIRPTVDMRRPTKHERLVMDSHLDNNQKRIESVLEESGITLNENWNGRLPGELKSVDKMLALELIKEDENAK